MLRTLFAALTPLLALAAGAAEPAVSTGAARVRGESPAPLNPWSLAYGISRRGDRYGQIDYRLRWSLDDFKRGKSGPPELARPVEETFRGLLQGMRVDVYGVALRPFRDMPLNVPPAGPEFSASTAAAAGAAPPARRRRPLYSWERLYEDLENSARRETERFIVREGFNRALPGHRDAPFDQKKALGYGILELGRGALKDESASGP